MSDYGPLAGWFIAGTAGLVAGLLVASVSGMLCRRYRVDRPGGHAAAAWCFPAIGWTTFALFVASYARYGLSQEYITTALFAAIMVTVAAVDVQTYSIPNVLVLAGIAALAVLVASGLRPVWRTVAGALAGGLIMVAAALASRGGMGAGDVKISFVIGGFVGWPAILLALFAGFAAAAACGLVLMALRLKGRKDFIPFGPFLAAGGMFAQLFAPPVMAWYWSRVVAK